MLVLSVMLVGCGAVEGPDDAGAMDSGVMIDAGFDAGMEVPDAGMEMDAGMQCTPDTWTNFGQQFFAQRCNGCHGFNQLSVGTQRAEITARIESNDMPRGSSLTSAQKTRVLTWLNCGAP
ncbi:MAG: hypothetical protein ACO1OB_05100 [Archangium sp.]